LEFRLFFGTPLLYAVFARHDFEPFSNSLILSISLQIAQGACWLCMAANVVVFGTYLYCKHSLFALKPESPVASTDIASLVVDFKFHSGARDDDTFMAMY
jgi:hypothetical protein